MAGEKELVPGVEIELAGKKYILPPLTAGQLRKGILAKMKENDELVDKGQYYEALNVKSAIIAEALRRNYPHITDEDVEDMLDLRNYEKAWEVILGGSGLRTKAFQEARDKVDFVPPTRETPAHPNGTLDQSTENSSEHTPGPTKTLIN
jgi:hypothetical protein